MPWSVVALAIALVTLGCLAIARSQDLADSSGSYLKRQLVWSVICIAAMLLASCPSYRILIRYSYVALAISIALLVAVYWFPKVNGSHRWIRFGPIGMQPSEFAKLACVLGLSRYLMFRDSYRRLWGLLVPLALVMIPLVLVLREPDLGTALVFLPVLFVMLFAAGARVSHLGFALLAALVLTPLLWSQMSREQKSRITALAEQTRAGEAPTDDGYQLHQAKQLLALGGWGGSWLGGEVTKDRTAYYVPESHTDAIAVVLGERFGLLGLAVLLLLFLLLVWRILVVAHDTREPYGRLAAIGVAALLATQVTINLGMLVGLLPITGLTLPLVSYGGSSLLANALALGLVLNVGLRPGYEVTNEPFRFAE
jgi:cell division protein FtsW (lipid II flippase)